MNFCSVRDLRNTKKEIWDNLDKQGNIIVTNNGKPKAVLMSVSEDSLEVQLKAIEQAKLMMLFNKQRGMARKKGFLSDGEIEDEIAKTRKEKRLA